MSECTRCNDDSHGHKYCENCISLRSNACSTIKQNSRRLEKLFTTKRYTFEWFEKFECYVNNIRKQEAILMEFLEKDAKRRIETLK